MHNKIKSTLKASTLLAIGYLIGATVNNESRSVRSEVEGTTEAPAKDLIYRPRKGDPLPKLLISDDGFITI